MKKNSATASPTDLLEYKLYEKCEFFRVKNAYYLGKNLEVVVSGKGQPSRKIQFLSQKRDFFFKKHTLIWVKISEEHDGAIRFSKKSQKHLDFSHFSIDRLILCHFQTIY